ncbi:MAG: glutaminase A [Halobacteriovoraceae bacterium]|jgi:glutaminase|nr:glutaminase A [Halobacteriovoraceae bacterium]
MDKPDYAKAVSFIYNEVQDLYGVGVKASYIPALKSVDSKQFAMTLVDDQKNIYSVGDDKVNFSIQSVTKVFTLCMALNEVGEEIWGRMDREPSGKSFDSLIRLEEHHGVPSNPFLNSGAIVIADILLEFYGKHVIDRYLSFLRTVTGNKKISIDKTIFLSEKVTGHKNYAFARYMKSFGNIINDIDDVLDVYFSFCSVSLNNIDLAKAFYFLMNKGESLDGTRITSHRHCKRINSLMFTCGTYDEVGDFAYLVGLPAKSGVSGAIGGCLPGHYSVSVWSPELNIKGNSVLGYKALELLTTIIDKSYLS